MIYVWDNGEEYEANDTVFIDGGDLPREDVVALLDCPRLLREPGRTLAVTDRLEWLLPGGRSLSLAEWSSPGQLFFRMGDQMGQLEPWEPAWGRASARVLLHLYRAWKNEPRYRPKVNDPYSYGLCERHAFARFEAELKRRGVLPEGDL